MSHTVRVPILMYHKIERLNKASTVKGHYVSPNLFKKHLSLLKLMGYTAIPLSSLYRENAKLPKKPVVITFDDGYVNFLQNARPALKSVGYSATVYLVANQLGGTNAWDTSRGDVEERLMSVDQVLEAHRQGTEFGSHTLDHADLAAVSTDEAWKQIADSKSKLEADLGFPIETFCYPYGRKNLDVQKMVEQAGYRLACSTERGQNTAQTDRFALKRINVRRDTWAPVLALKLLRGDKHDV